MCPIFSNETTRKVLTVLQWVHKLTNVILYVKRGRINLRHLIGVFALFMPRQCYNSSRVTCHLLDERSASYKSYVSYLSAVLLHGWLPHHHLLGGWDTQWCMEGDLYVVGERARGEPLNLHVSLGENQQTSWGGWRCFHLLHVCHNQHVSHHTVRLQYAADSRPGWSITII